MPAGGGEIAARERRRRLPAFAQGMVARGVECYAAEHGIPVVTPEVMQAVRQAAEASLDRTPPSPPEPRSGR